MQSYTFLFNFLSFLWHLSEKVLTLQNKRTGMYFALIIAKNKQKYIHMVITKSNFDEIVNSGKPVVVDFWATWCGPCRRVAPVIEELANEYEGRAVVGKVDVEEEDELASQFGIRNIPTVLFIKDGQVVDKVVGAMPKAAYEEKLQALL